MDVVRHDGKLMDVPTIHSTTFVAELGEPLDERSVEDLSSVLGDKHDVVHAPMDGMASSPEYWF